MCVAKLCHRQKGVGADGVILLEHSQLADFRMRIFNSDGSEAEMCGNGIRCLVAYLRMRNLACTSIETLAGLHAVQGDWICLGRPLITGDIINTGVPHIVLFQPWDEMLGKNLCQAKNANINFVSKTKSGLSVRTYERGAGPTLFCGTGGAASAFAYGIWPVKVNKEMIYNMIGQEIWMQGPSNHVFDGQINADSL